MVFILIDVRMTYRSVHDVLPNVAIDHDPLNGSVEMFLARFRRWPAAKEERQVQVEFDQMSVGHSFHGLAKIIKCNLAIAKSVTITYC